MALTQIQIIQSLAEALSWFEKELSWGVREAELRHLTGRIGELYAAMITRGQMALSTNQHGYDVISAENERISVKTVTSSALVNFNPNTFDQVDRVMILRLNVDPEDGVSIEAILDKPVDEARSLFQANKLSFYIPNGSKPRKSIDNLQISQSANFEGKEIRQYENGTINVLIDGVVQTPAKPYLREIASRIGVDLAFDSGAEKNTRHLGAGIIKQLKQMA